MTRLSFVTASHFSSKGSGVKNLRAVSVFTPPSPSLFQTVIKRLLMCVSKKNVQLIVDYIQFPCLYRINGVATMLIGVPIGKRFISAEMNVIGFQQGRYR